MHDQVAAAAFLQVGQAFPPQDHRRPRLRPRRQRDIDFAVQRRGLHRCPQCCLGKGDGDFGVQIGAVAFKARIVRDPDVDVQVARTPAAWRPLASPGQPQRGTVLHALGHVDLQSLLHHPQATPAARRTGPACHRALAATGRTGGGDHEKALCVHDLAATPTLRAGFPRGARRSARSLAILAGGAPLHLHFLRRAGRHLGQGQLNLALDVGPAPGATTRAAAKSATKKIAEDVGESREDVAHIAEATAKTAPTRPLVAVAIVQSALFGVRQHLIGLRRLLEACLGLPVVGVAVWMELEGKLAVGALQLRRIHLAGYTKHLVVVLLFTHGLTA